ncbi:MAG: PAS domain S-box protein [Desulfobacteraceae bacterium]
MLFEKAPLAMFIVNRDRRLIRYNEAAAAMAGRVKKTGLGLRGGEFFRCVTAFEDPKGCGFSKACEVCIVRKTVMDTFQTGLEHRSVEASIPVKDEKGIQKTWVLLSTVIVNFGENEEGVLICMKDITERKRTEEALRQSERKFRLVSETIENVFWMSTCGLGEMLYISPAYERLWEKSRESLYRSPKSFMEAIHPDDRETYSNVLTQHHNVGKSYRCEYRIVKRDGSIRWICEKGYPVLHQSDKVNLMSGVCTDITELKRTEEALREKNDELVLKGKIANLFLTSPNQKVFADVLDLLRNEFNCQYGYFGYIAQEGDLICPSMTTTIMDQCRIPGKSIVFPKDSWGGLWGKSLQERIAVRQNQTLNVPQGHISLNNTLVVPIVIENELVGQVALADKPSGFNRQDEQKLTSMANFIAPILKIYLEKENVKTQLLLKAEKLSERNIALKVLLENRDQEKRQQAEKLSKNFDRLVFPYFEKLKSCNDREGRRTLLEIIESNTQDCLSTEKPYHHSYYREFTPMEVQVADLIKSGKTSKEIAVLLNISPRSVYFHRNNLRRKLNISKTNTNLRTFLTTHHNSL